MEQHEVAQKRAVRETVRSRRKAMTAQQRFRTRDALTSRLIELVRASGASSVSCYAPIPGEPDTSGFLEWALREDVEVLLPISLPGGSLEWARFDGDGLIPGRHGISEPRGRRLPAAAAGDLDLLLIPACAVDERGTRLGWGLGYYDRMLGGLSEPPPIHAVVFDDEILPRLPRAPHDIPIDGAVAPRGLRRFPQG